MRCSCFLLAVKDIKVARAFYEELFDLKVQFDFGLNVAFDCGLALQEDFGWLTGIKKTDIKTKANNAEIVFETEDYPGFCQKLLARADVELLHGSMEYSWGQKVIRFYDPDAHLIEVGESMQKVAERFLAEGMTIPEIAKKMDASEAEVKLMLSGK